MNFKQLEYFSAVAEAKSISMAARNLHVAQPPVSRQIAMLEDELGVVLFLRTNKGIELTEAGRCLYEQSLEMFHNIQKMADSVRDVDAGMKGQLKLGVIYSDIPVVMDYLKEYHDLYPQVELYIRLGNPEDLLDDLTKAKLHVLFLRSQTEVASGLQEKVLGEDPLELVMTERTDPAPGQPEVPIEALRDVPMCLLRSDDLWSYRNHLVSQCQRAGFTPNIVCQCYDTPMAMQMVQSGFGVSFLPRSIVKTHPDSGIYAKPITGVTAKSYPTMIWSNDNYYANCVKRFIALALGRRQENK